MLVKTKNILRKISDGIYQETAPTADDLRPCEWRRRFNPISLPLKNIEIVIGCSVHSIEFKLKEWKKAEPLKQVKSDVYDQIRIEGIVDEEQMQDSLYFTVEGKKEKDIFSVEMPSGNTNFVIKAGPPTEENEGVPAGLYYGTAFRSNYDPGEDDIYFDLPAPKEQVLSLISALRADPNSTIKVGVHLLSFTYEVDDAFREHYHSQNIILDEYAPCFLSWAGVTSKVGQHSVDSQYEDEGEIEDSYEEELTPEQREHQELLQVLLSYLKPLNGLVVAIWVLIIVIALSAIFG